MPPGVITLTLPFAPAPTVAVIWFAETTVKPVAFTPPNCTCVAPVKFVPLIVISVPVIPAIGVKFVMVGAATKVKPAIAPGPPTVTTCTLPLAPAPTTAVSCVGET